MEQVLFYASVFLTFVVDVVDAVSEWLKAQGLSSWLIMIGIFTLYGFHVIEKWSIELQRRIAAIEEKLGIEHTPPADTKRPWIALLAVFVAGVYILGKSLHSESLFTLIAGSTLSGLMLLLCAFGAYCFADESIRKYLRKRK